VNIVFISARHYYAPDNSRGLNYEYQHIVPALSDMGNDIFHLDYLGAQDVTTALEKAVAEIKPECIIYQPFEGEMDMVRFGALPGVKMLLLADDDWRREFGLSLAPHTDYVLTNQPDGAEAYGSKYIAFQWGCYPRLYQPTKSRPIDLVFVGQAYGERPAYIDALRRAGLTVTVRGLGWQEGVAHDVAALLMAAKMSVNFCKSSRGNVQQTKARTFEIPASGTVALLEYAPRLEDYFEDGKEVLFWRTTDELVDKARWVMSHPAEATALAQAGKERAFAEHSYAMRFKAIFEKAGLQ
jgi:spore maturation protein CgeB